MDGWMDVILLGMTIGGLIDEKFPCPDASVPHCGIIDLEHSTPSLSFNQECR
jgi:hypothetical protein